VEWFIILWIVGIGLWLLSKMFSKTAETVNEIKTIAKNRECPYCKSQIPKDAIVCRYCQRDVDPYKEPTTDEIIASRNNRLELINDVLQSFRESYPKVKFTFNDSLQRIKISPEFSLWSKGENKKKIQQEMIKALNDKGSKANAAFLSDNEITTVGFWDNVVEQTVEDMEKDKK